MNARISLTAAWCVLLAPAGVCRSGAVIVRAEYCPDVMRLQSVVEAWVKAHLGGKGLEVSSGRAPGGDAAARASVRLLSRHNPVPHVARESVRLTLSLGAQREGEAERLLAEIARRIGPALEREYAQRLAALREQARAVEQPIAKAQGRLAGLLRKEKATGLVVFEMDSIAKQTAALQTMLQALRIDLAGKRARQKVLRGRPSRPGQAAGTKRDAGDDALAKELERIVRLQEKQLTSARVLFAGGRFAEIGLRQMEIELAAARARLALVRRLAAGDTPGGGPDELESLATDIAEILAKQEAARQRLAFLQDQRDKLRRYEGTLLLEIAKVRQSLRELTLLRAKLAATVERAGKMRVTAEKPERAGRN